MFAAERRLVFAKGVVRIAIQPSFSWLRGSYDRMPGGARVFTGVPIGRAVTAQSDTALLTGAEMHPLRSDFHALSALGNLRQLHGRDRIEM
jgi:hypothetical protein